MPDHHGTCGKLQSRSIKGVFVVVRLSVMQEIRSHLRKTEETVNL